MGEVQGQGYVGQALGAADMLAAVYADQLRFRADDPAWEGRDRFLLSTGHYAIGHYAALAEAGIVPVKELETYGSDNSRLPMSGMSTYTPGMEISGGSLGHGLTIAVGMALGLRLPGVARPGLQLPLRRRTRRRLHMGGRDGRPPPPARQPDRHGGHQRPAGRRQDGHCAAHRARHRESGKPSAGTPSAWTGTTSVRCWPRSTTPPPTPPPSDVPSVILCDTKVGRGVPLLEDREKAHFMRIEEHEWQICREQLTAGYERKAAR